MQMIHRNLKLVRKKLATRRGHHSDALGVARRFRDPAVAVEAEVAG